MTRRLTRGECQIARIAFVAGVRRAFEEGRNDASSAWGAREAIEAVVALDIVLEDPTAHASDDEELVILRSLRSDR